MLKKKRTFLLKTLLVTYTRYILKIHLLGVVREVGLLLGLYFKDGVHEVLVRDGGGGAAQRDHAGLHAHRLALGAVEVVGGAGQLLEVHVWADVHFSVGLKQSVK